MKKVFGLILMINFLLACSLFSRRSKDVPMGPQLTYKFEISRDQLSMNLIREADGKVDNVRRYMLPPVAQSIRSWSQVSQCADRGAFCAEDMCENLFIVNGSENRIFLMPLPQNYVTRPTGGWDPATARFTPDCDYFDVEMNGYSTIRTRVDEY